MKQYKECEQLEFGCHYPQTLETIQSHYPPRRTFGLIRLLLNLQDQANYTTGLQENPSYWGWFASTPEASQVLAVFITEQKPQPLRTWHMIRKALRQY